MAKQCIVCKSPANHPGRPYCDDCQSLAVALMHAGMTYKLPALKEARHRFLAGEQMPVPLPRFRKPSTEPYDIYKPVWTESRFDRLWTRTDIAPWDESLGEFRQNDTPDIRAA